MSEALLRKLLNDPSQLDTLESDSVLELISKISPYGRVLKDGELPDGKKRVVVCSYTNLEEDYLKRLLMTSLVGFIFQMKNEYEAPSEVKKWSPASYKKKDATVDLIKLEKDLEGALAAVKIARETNIKGCEQQITHVKTLLTAYNTNKVTEQYSKGEVSEKTKTHIEETTKLLKEAEDALEKEKFTYNTSVYSALHGIHKMGKMADDSLYTFYLECKGHEALKDMPMPPDPSSIEVPQKVVSNIINDFLTRYFKYNPNEHVRAGHHSKTFKSELERLRAERNQPTTLMQDEDQTRANINVLLTHPGAIPENIKTTLLTLTKNQRNYNDTLHILQDEEYTDAVCQMLTGKPFDQTEVSTATKMKVVQTPLDLYKKYIFPIKGNNPVRTAAENIPPQDIFHNFNFYYSTNYDALRLVTEALYADKPWIDFTLAPWTILEGTQEEITKAFDEYGFKYGNEIGAKLHAIEFGAWSMLSDFSENRKNISFYNKNTAALAAIFDRHKADEKMGEEILANTIAKSKAKNIKETGPDHPDLVQYAAGGKVQADIPRMLTTEDRLRMEKAKGDLTAIRELKLLDEAMERYTEIYERHELLKLANKNIPHEEVVELEQLRQLIPQYRDALAVPEGVQEVKVITTDHKTGNVSVDQIYTL